MTFGPQPGTDVPQKRYWFVPDLLLVSFLGFYSGLTDPLGVIAYRGGLHNDDRIGSGLAVLFVVLFVPAVLCLVVLVLRMSITWPKHISQKGRLWLTRLLVTVGVTSCLVSPFIPIRVPGYGTYTAGFRRYVQREVDLPAVRSWLSSLDSNDLQRMKADLDRKGGSEPYGWRAVAWPPMIARLNPGYVDLGKTKDGRPKIRLTWGGPFGHWGAEIGPEDMEVPATRERKGQEFGPPDHRYTVYDTGEYRLPFAPGAYVWHEIQ